MEISLGFESIAIKQKKNICKSRNDVDTSSEIIRGITIQNPIIPANMSTVINADFYRKISALKGFAIMHRAFSTEEEYIRTVRSLNGCKNLAVSVGVGPGQGVLVDKLAAAGAEVFVIDIAHGYSDEVIEMARGIKTAYPNLKVVVGNTVNPDMLDEVDFCDAVKVGIAQGFACETKNTAGCTEKQFSAVLKFKERAKQLGMPIISDGGIREPADFVKAIAAGASSVMAGKVFAMCPESAAETVTVDGEQRKLYAGMASRHVQDAWKGALKPGTCPEGGVRYLDVGEPVAALMERYIGALKSGITYAGGKDIKSFQDSAEFIRLV